MIRYTTPTIILTVDKVLPGEAEIYVTFQQGDVKLTKMDADVALNTKTTTIDVTLTQAESAKFRAGEPVTVQVNWIDEDGTRDATRPATIAMFENLLNKVISYD